MYNTVADKFEENDGIELLDFQDADYKYICDGGMAHIDILTNDNIDYCLKAIEKTEGKIEDAKNEIQILRQFKGQPGIVRYIKSIENRTHFLILTELYNGGDLEKCLDNKWKKVGDNKQIFSEGTVQRIMREILPALRCLHSNNIVHRDLKLANIMVHYSNKNEKNDDLLYASFYLIDFGFARDASSAAKGSLIKEQKGTYAYMEPRILAAITNYMQKRKGVRALHTKARINIRKERDKLDIELDKKIDIWSMGVLTYQLLMGKVPFGSKDVEQILNKIKEGKLELPGYLSTKAKDFIKSMLIIDPRNRANADDLCKSPFITDTIY